jgi:hypothetical protein
MSARFVVHGAAYKLYRSMTRQQVQFETITLIVIRFSSQLGERSKRAWRDAVKKPDEHFGVHRFRQMIAYVADHRFRFTRCATHLTANFAH